MRVNAFQMRTFKRSGVERPPVGQLPPTVRGADLGDRGQFGAPARGPALSGAGRPSRESPGNGLRVLEGDLLPLLPEWRGRVVAERRRGRRQLLCEAEERRGQRAPAPG